MPRHCSACGGWIGERAPVACAACGTRHWLNAKPAAAALVVAEGRLLLTRRAIEPWRGLWCAPSGFCDGDEHPAACAVREAGEEAGIRVRVVGYLGHWVDEYLPAGREGADPRVLRRVVLPRRARGHCRRRAADARGRRDRRGSRRTAASPRTSRRPATAPDLRGLARSTRGRTAATPLPDAPLIHAARPAPLSGEWWFQPASRRGG